MKRLFIWFSILFSVNSYASCNFPSVIIKDKHVNRIRNYDKCYYNSSFTESYFNYNQHNNQYYTFLAYAELRKIRADHNQSNPSKYNIHTIKIINQIINNQNKNGDKKVNNDKLEQIKNILDPNTFFNSELSFILNNIDNK